jgi:hypothetical protein
MIGSQDLLVGLAFQEGSVRDGGGGTVQAAGPPDGGDNGPETLPGLPDVAGCGLEPLPSVRDGRPQQSCTWGLAQVTQMPQRGRGPHSVIR